MSLHIAIAGFVLGASAFAGTLTVTSIQTPSGTTLGSGPVTGGIIAFQVWQNLAAVFDDATQRLFFTGQISCINVSPCQETFRVNFAGTGFQGQDLKLGMIGFLFPRLTNIPINGNPDNLLYVGQAQGEFRTVLNPSLPDEVNIFRSYNIPEPLCGLVTPPLGCFPTNFGSVSTASSVPGSFTGYTELTIRLYGDLTWDSNTLPYTNTFGPAAASVPEPASYGLVAGALGLLALLRRSSRDRKIAG